MGRRKTTFSLEMSFLKGLGDNFDLNFRSKRNSD